MAAIIFEEDINDVKTQHVYMLHLREARRVGDNIYKIGKTTGIDNRMRGYPKGSEIIIVMRVDNCSTMEDNLMAAFKQKFIQRTDYGREFFEGDRDVMQLEFIKVVTNIKRDSDPFIVVDDSFDIWLRSNCVMSGRETAKNLYRLYQKTYDIDIKTFKQKLAKSGFKKNGRYYEGISIKVSSSRCIIS